MPEEKCCFKMDLTAGIAGALVVGGGVISVKVTKLDDGTSGKFRVGGVGVGLIASLGFRVSSAEFCCDEDNCPTVSAFAGASVSVTTFSLSFILGFGYTKITISGVPGCGTIVFKEWHGEAGAAGLGGIHFRGSMTPIVP